MAAFCIPREIGEKMTEALRRGDFSMKDLMEMTSAERRAVFKDFSKELAADINASFEKALVSEQKNALVQWVQETFEGAKTSKPYKDIVAKIDDLNEILSPSTGDAFLEDLVRKKLGISLTPEMAKQVQLHVDNMKTYKALPLSETGQYNIKYWEEKNKLERYIASLEPSNFGLALLHVGGRASMLARVGSVTKNVINNALSGLNVAVDRLVTEAIDSGFYGKGAKKVPTLPGSNFDLSVKYVTEQTKMQALTGNSTVRAKGLQDTDIILGEKRIHVEGPGKARKALRAYSHAVLGIAQGVPDIVQASSNFAFTADIISMKMAKEAGYTGKTAKGKAREMMLDAMKLEPVTPEGLAIREQAQFDALVATNQHETPLKRIALKLRNAIDSAMPRLKPGSAVVPFVSTTANVMFEQVARNGWSAIHGSYELIREFKRNGFKMDRETFKTAMNNIVKTGTTMLFALWLSSHVKKGEWEGEYDPATKERLLREGQNVSPNSIILSDLPGVGDVSIPLDWLGTTGTTLTGMLLARDYAGDLPNQAWQSFQASLKAAAGTPGFQEFADAWNALREGSPTWQKGMEKVPNAMADFILSRVIPGEVSDVAKMTDQYERKATPGNILESIYARFPYLREQVPVRQTFTGRKITAAPTISLFLFGSAIKVPTDDPIVKEYKRLETSYGSTPTVPELDYPSSQSRLGELKKQLGEQKYQEAKTFYRETFGERIGRYIQSDAYEALPLDGKINAINKQNETVLQETLKKFGYVAPQKKHTPDTENSV